jgi:WhiB family transcriptional regulator, redox-sensing transcriptional regulator
VRSTVWMSRAGCKDVNPELFFPLGSSDAPDWQIARAKRVCASCPVRVHCLAYSVETGQKYGIWGGLTELERRRIRVGLQRSTAQL